MWELDYTESWAPKNWCFWTVVLEKTLKSPLDCKIKPVNPKGNQSWILVGRTDAEAEAPIFWPPDVKNQHSWKSPWCWERLKAERQGDDRMRWSGGITNSGHEFERALGDGEGQGSLACCHPWSCKIRPDQVTKPLQCFLFLAFKLFCLFFKFIFNWRTIALRVKKVLVIPSCPRPHGR